MADGAEAPLVAGPVLEIAFLRHDYGSATVLHDFSFAATRGQHSLLLGPSGSGKTTLINLIAGLLTVQHGTIRIAGETMAGLPGVRDDLRRRRIGIIFQTLRLVEALSVTANLRLAQRLAGRERDDAEIGRLLDEVGLGHRAHARPRALSQGEAQRAAVARALVGRPDLLIADEPTSALDDGNAERIARLLVGTADAHGSTLLIATHDARLKAHIPHALVLAPIVQEVA
ncbi:ABC transporter ATP-binding protein [Croceibacterium mercuriale]|uniref:ABC transporter ATP-binding protein n=1 Tax=Croceibacterium mercuriale TaxID=1572751 RepID=A0A0B2BYT8_9SPHN|nr:ATP-binding cassette domain-containing protein [Croceibacterium mercuriale]KHL25020.1 ABC transporter ATP-binding protein [Croceibacterium mercuriale]